MCAQLACIAKRKFRAIVSALNASDVIDNVVSDVTVLISFKLKQMKEHSKINYQHKKNLVLTNDVYLRFSMSSLVYEEQANIHAKIAPIE